MLFLGGLCWGWREAVPAQGFLDALGAGASDALVDREGPLEVGGGVAGFGVAQVTVADSLQGPCLLQGCADLTGDSERLAVVLARLASGRGPGRELAEAVQHLGLAVRFAGVAQQPQRLTVAVGGSGVVAGFLLGQAELVAGQALGGRFAEVTQCLQGLLLAGDGGPVVAGGMPGWQIVLIAAVAALLAAVLAVIADRAWAERRYERADAA